MVLPPNAAERVPDLEIVRHRDAGAGRLREMHMAVDAAGQHQLAGRIDDLGCVAEVDAERGDRGRP